MVEKLPFTSYDFWAYLSAGFLLLFGFDFALGLDLFNRSAWTVVQTTVAVSAAYAIGHLIAGFSSLILEKGLVESLLGPPRLTLFGQVKRGRLVRAAFRNYFKRLPRATCDLALNRGRSSGVAAPGEALFWAAFNHARSSAVTMRRIENFLNLYGFCRNVAIVALLDAAVLFWAYRWGGRGEARLLLWSRVAFVFFIAMVYRYLKFYRLYSVELFTSFAYSKDASASQAEKA